LGRRFRPACSGVDKRWHAAHRSTHPGHCGHKSDHASVEILHDLVQPVKDGAVRLIKNEQIKEGRTELFVTAGDGLKRGDV
jgi:hypothetical protein